MAHEKVSKHNLKTLIAKRGISSRELAKKIGTSAPHMSRLVNGKSPLTAKWLLKLSAALKVPTSAITGLAVDKNFGSACDDTLLGSIMGWLLEAADAQQIELSRLHLTRLTGLVYKSAVETPLTAEQTQQLAVTSVRIVEIITG
jgi:DNA-binding Xre family transcriptional regulator